MIRSRITIFRLHLRQCPARSYATSQVTSQHDGAILVSSAQLKRKDKYLQHYNLAVQSGKTSDSYDAWLLQRPGGNRVPGACAFISTLQLNKVVETGQYLNIRSRDFRPFVSREVLVHGKDVGRAEFYFPPDAVPPGDLLRVYYDRDLGLLRFQTQDGEPLSEATDIDLIAKAHQCGIRPLLLLAHAEGLVDKVPSGRLSALDFKTNLDSGFYIRANLQKTRIYQPSISLPGLSRSFRFRLGLSGPPRPYIRFFPYIHKDQNLRFWDVEQSRDLDLRWGQRSKSWRPEDVQKRIPQLFEFAQTLGYWG